MWIALINPGSDTSGDEGELFSANLMGLSLSPQEKYRIAQDNDHSFVNVNGQTIPVEQSLPDLAGNTLATARVVTVGTTATTFTDFVGGLDTDDYYKFTLANGGNLTANLTGLAADANLRLLDSTGAFVTGSFNAGAANDNFQKLLLAGTYYVKVSAGVKADFSGFIDTNYSLSLQSTPLPVNPIDNAGNTLATAKAITVGSTATSFNDSVWNLDTDDYYKFTLASSGNLTANLTGLAADANFELLDSTGAFITGSFNAGSVNDSFQRLLLVGTYYVQVSAGVKADFSGFTDTNYTLGLSLASSQVLPTITISATDASAGEKLAKETANPGKFTLTRTGNKTASLTVNYTISGTATNGTDYQTLTKTVIFAAGSATAIVDVTM